MNKFFYVATKEWITSKELQKRLNEGVEFKCNECNNKIGDNVKTLAEGIFCESCFNKIIKDLT